jgi:hypothetical protein
LFGYAVLNRETCSPTSYGYGHGLLSGVKHLWTKTDSGGVKSNLARLDAAEALLKLSERIFFFRLSPNLPPQSTAVILRTIKTSGLTDVRNLLSERSSVGYCSPLDYVGDV